MKTRDLEKERSERPLEITQFLATYNEDLPASFPKATIGSLRAFRKAFPGLFKGSGAWALGPHRKKFMDWLPQYIKLRS